MPDATTSDGDTSPKKVTPTDCPTTMRVATMVGIAAPTHWEKKEATPALLSTSLTRVTTQPSGSSAGR